MPNSFVRHHARRRNHRPAARPGVGEIIGFWEKKGRQSPTTEGSGRAVRGAHAKTFGVVEANVEFLERAPAEYAQGIYRREPGQHGALIRFSRAPFRTSRARCAPRDGHRPGHETVRHRRTETHGSSGLGHL